MNEYCKLLLCGSALLSWSCSSTGVPGQYIQPSLRRQAETSTNPREDSYARVIPASSLTPDEYWVYQASTVFRARYDSLKAELIAVEADGSGNFQRLPLTAVEKLEDHRWDLAFQAFKKPLNFVLISSSREDLKKANFLTDILNRNGGGMVLRDFRLCSYKGPYLPGHPCGSESPTLFMPAASRTLRTIDEEYRQTAARYGNAKKSAFSAQDFQYLQIDLIHECRLLPEHPRCRGKSISSFAWTEALPVLFYKSRPFLMAFAGHTRSIVFVSDEFAKDPITVQLLCYIFDACGEDSRGRCGLLGICF